MEGEYIKFCEYMEYELAFEKNGFYHYFIPEGHLCRLKINFEKWTKGSFDKKNFLENIHKK
jgi:uncharacterized protein (DUF1919 family)